MDKVIRIFKYIPEDDAFLPTDEYREIADDLNLTEWNPVVWIGRLFIMDNDLGEHWFDNWDLRADLNLSYDHLIIDPEKFQDGRDGPCNTPEFRKRFWTDVLKSLQLSLDLLFDKARHFNQLEMKHLEKYPNDPNVTYLTDLEDRIAEIKIRYSE